MRRLWLVIMMILLSPALSFGQAGLESPQNGGQESGLGDVHGWKCSAAGPLTFTIDNGPPGVLIYGNSRGDTGCHLRR